MGDSVLAEPDARGRPVAAEVVAPEACDGEFARAGWGYAAGVWLVSILAMITNLGEAFVRKLTRRKKMRIAEILWSMGRRERHVSSFFFDRFSRFHHQVKYGAAGWRSLDLFYNYHDKVQPKLGNNLEGWVTRYWMGKLENRQAVTNRLKLATNLLTTAMDELSGEPEIRLLSIASGSAQAVIQAVRRRPDLHVRVLLIDADRTALDAARKLAMGAGVGACFSYRADTTNGLEEACAQFRPHIIEMIDFLDYRTQRKAIALVSRVREQLPAGGVFITGNIHPNREKIFLDWVLLWPMIYRTSEEFAEVIVEAGFEPGRVRLIYEPFKIHGIAVCRK